MNWGHFQRCWSHKRGKGWEQITLSGGGRVGAESCPVDPLAWIPLTVMVLWDSFQNQKIIEGPIIFC